MYQPALSRFQSLDPLSPNGVDLLDDNNWFGDRLTQMRNLYGYANNSPLNFIDPSGLACAPADPCAIVVAKKPCSGLVVKMKPDSKTVRGLTYCADGKTKFVVNPPEDGLDEKENKLRGDKCFKNCVQVHEEYHMKQIETWCPQICPCFKDRHGAGEFDVGYADDGKTEKIWECPTLRLTIQCLNDAIEKRTGGCDLGLLNNEKLKLIIDHRDKCGGRWQERVPPTPPYPFGD